MPSSLTEKLAALGIASSSVASDDGALVKTVLLKDKHSHVYAIVALSDSEINLKALSTRLGLGKAPLAPLPEAALLLLLQAPAAPASFMGLVEPAARDVVSLLDVRLVAAPSVHVPAGNGPGNIDLSGADVEKFLRSLGGAVSTVDLALSPKIDRDHPPDLKPLADGAAVVEAVKAAVAASPAAPASVKPAAKAAAKAAGKLKTSAASGQPAALDLDRMVTSIVDRCLALGGAQQPAAGSSQEAMRMLLADVRTELTSLKNAAYAAGFSAARGAMRAQLEPQTL